MKKILILLGSICLVATSTSTIISCGLEEEISLPSLEQIIVNPNIGYFNSIPIIEDEILNRLAEQYPTLNLTQVQIVNVNNETATISVIENSAVYLPGSIVVNYQANVENVKQDLKTIISQPNLNFLINANNFDEPTSEIILSKVKELNQNLIPDEVEIIKIDKYAGKATIKAIKDSIIYMNSIEVNFKVALKWVFGVGTLKMGTIIKAPTTQEVIEFLIENDPSKTIDSRQLDIIFLLEGLIIVREAAQNSNYFGIINVEYKFWIK